MELCYQQMFGSSVVLQGWLMCYVKVCMSFFYKSRLYDWWCMSLIWILNPLQHVAVTYRPLSQWMIAQAILSSQIHLTVLMMQILSWLRVSYIQHCYLNCWTTELLKAQSWYSYIFQLDLILLLKLVALKILPKSLLRTKDQLLNVSFNFIFYFNYIK